VFSGKNAIIWIAILVIGIFWLRRRYFNCTRLWSELDSSARNIFYEQMNKVDNNSTLKQRIETEAAENNRSYESQKVYYSSQFLVDEKIITDIQRRKIIKCKG
jgi:hypothetical protein|tara:strand:- start:191 stop:499 length:309 start_codon:yes stop_codon:yes gene_type:complete